MLVAAPGETPLLNATTISTTWGFGTLDCSIYIYFEMGMATTYDMLNTGHGNGIAMNGMESAQFMYWCLEGKTVKPKGPEINNI